MNKQLNLAVAAAVLAFSASANAGITIPAGDWTVDIGGNMNAFYTHSSKDTYTGGVKNASTPDSNTIGTGLLPAAFGIGAKSRQNDLDVAFQFSFFTGTSAGGTGTGSDVRGYTGALQANQLNIRQAFLSFGDASWGTIKLGRDLGTFGSDAILSDMTLLGVGNGAPGGSSTLGRIGSGYMYADWVGQAQYASPNWNGFAFQVAVREPWSNVETSAANKDDMGYEGKVTYDFAANDVTGRVWLSGITQKNSGSTGTVGGSSGYTSKGVDVGGKVSYMGATLVGYYYDGEGLDSQNSSIAGGLMFLGGQKTDDNGGYVQATYVIPGIGTKLGASWGTNNSKSASNSTTAFDYENKSWIIGAYHPLTKSLNLVAEYANQEITNSATSAATATKTEIDQFSLGAIMFF